MCSILCSQYESLILHQHTDCDCKYMADVNGIKVIFVEKKKQEVGG